MPELVFLARTDEPDRIVVACPNCRRITKQLVLASKKTSLQFQIKQSHTCQICGLSYRAVSADRSAEFQADWQSYQQLGETEYNYKAGQTFFNAGNTGSQQTLDSDGYRHPNPIKFDKTVAYWKNQLLDMSKRNRMVNYRETRRSTLKILDPEFSELFNLLAIGEKELTFRRSIDRDSDTRTYLFLSLLDALSQSVPVHIGDILTSVSHKPRDQRDTLNNLRLKAKLAQDEQGTNILYLSFGFLEWKDYASSDDTWVKSPVLMMPVSFKTATAQIPFTLLRNNDDIEVNPTLDYLFNLRYGEDLPTFELRDEQSIDRYMVEIEDIANRNGWKLHREVSLGLLSFLKISMFRDLSNHHERICKNPIIRAITGDYNAIAASRKDFSQVLLDNLPPQDCYQVLDSDSSQHHAVLLSKEGTSFVLQGPPGTGKSQTIANIIAEAFADGKKVLFVAEKAAALNVVHQRLADVGLADFCLALHNHKANKKEILANIAANLRLPRHNAKKKPFQLEFTELMHNRHTLNQYVDELHGKIQPLGKSLYEVYGELSLAQNAPLYPLHLESLASVSAEELYTMLFRVKSFAAAFAAFTVRFSQNPWKDTVVGKITQEFEESFNRDIRGLDGKLSSLQRQLQECTSSLNLPAIRTWAGAVQLSGLLNEIQNAPLFPAAWANGEIREKLSMQAIHACIAKEDYHKLLKEVEEHFTDGVFTEDLDAWTEDMHNALEEMYPSGGTARSELAEGIAQCSQDRKTQEDAIWKMENVKAALIQGLMLFPLPVQNTIGDIRTFHSELRKLPPKSSIKPEWFKSQTLQHCRLVLINAYDHAESISKRREAILQNWDASALELDADAIFQRFNTGYVSILKVLKTSYYKDLRLMRSLSRKADKKISDGEIIALLRSVQKLNKEMSWFADNRQPLMQCFGSQYKGMETDWAAIEAGLSYAERLRILFPKTAAPRQVVELVCNRADHQAEYEQLSQIALAIDDQHMTEMLKAVSGFVPIDSPEVNLDDLLLSAKAQAAQFEKVDQLLTRITKHARKDIQSSAIPPMVDKIRKINAARADSIAQSGVFSEQFGMSIDCLETDWSVILASLNGVAKLMNCPGANLMSDRFVSRFCDTPSFREDIQSLNAVVSMNIQACSQGFTEFRKLFAADSHLENLAFPELIIKVSQCAQGIVLLDQWLTYQETKAACDQLGLQAFTGEVERQDSKTLDIEATFKRSFYTAWVEAVIGDKAYVSHFRRHRHDALIDQFVHQDLHQLKIASSRIRQNVIANIPEMSRRPNIPDELALFIKENNKKGKFLPLRKLFRSIPNLLPRLKPCLMMSPLSVAYFLEGDAYEFDMVIFDEASQIFPQDAIGSIIRGKQVIIAGDSKQLPPTNFFSVNTSNADSDYDFDEDDEDAVEISSSILEETASVLPNQTLLWHYRSRNESLIAFSNNQIYQKDLVTFPSNADSGKDNGVELIYVENGVYEGKGRNTAEAISCVELVKDHIANHPGRSLGIIAFSESQQRVISQEIDKFKEQNQHLKDFFAEGKEEEFFVKNLENVQGDERDTIIFSISYAKTREQKAQNREMYMRFGPLGQKGGERRLNVAITRAKWNIKLVSSIKASDIDISRTESDGIRLLKKYIEYAANHSGSVPETYGQAEKEPFVDTVASFLVQKGYRIQKYVGHSDYKVDIAVIHPQKSDYFVAGIECDGVCYAMAESARDRDRLRKSVMQAMGWRIHRIWSPEWVENQQSEANKLLTFIDDALQGNTYVKQTDVQPEETPQEPQQDKLPAMDAEMENGLAGEDNPYGFAELVEAAWGDTPGVHRKTGALKAEAIIKYILSVEQPLHLKTLYQRLAGALGYQMVTATVKSTVNAAVTGRLKTELKVDGEGFVSFVDYRVQNARIPQNGLTQRNINLISYDEIGYAMCTVTAHAIGISVDDLVDATAKALGYTRTTKALAKRLHDVLQRLIREGKMLISDQKASLSCTDAG